MKSRNFKISVVNTVTSKPLQGGNFSNKESADVFKQKMIEKYDLVLHGGFIANWNTKTSLHKNY